MKDIHITLPDEEYDKLKRVAEDLGTSMSDVVATLLRANTRERAILSASCNLSCKTCKYEYADIREHPCSTCGIQEGEHRNWQKKGKS